MVEREIEIPLFLGVCESALIRGDGILQDFYGVGDILLLAYFPQKLSGIFLLIGLPVSVIKGNKSVHLIIQDRKNTKNKAWRVLETTAKPIDGAVRINGFAKHYIGNGQAGTGLIVPGTQKYKVMPIPCPPLDVTEPTEIDVYTKIDDEEFKMGSFDCRFVPTPPISKEECLAIMSRPGASNQVNIKISCKKCNDEAEFYLPLNPESKPSNKFSLAKPLRESANEWICKCGESRMPLVYLKKGLHELFRRESIKDKPLNFVTTPLYQRGAIAAILSQYQKILSEYEDSEETIQKFMKLNPIIWNFLAPMQIWEKPPILTKYNADFAILTRTKILYFVEIEKPKTKLVKSDGGIHSELQVGLDQIRDWKIEVDKRREAVIDALNLVQKDVHDIRYILIAGMASKTKIEGLEKIRGMKTDANFIFCFDELASFLHSTETALINI
jgi:hypothetical protein